MCTSPVRTESYFLFLLFLSFFQKYMRWYKKCDLTLLLTCLENYLCAILSCKAIDLFRELAAAFLSGRVDRRVDCSLYAHILSSWRFLLVTSEANIFPVSSSLPLPAPVGSSFPHADLKCRLPSPLRSWLPAVCSLVFSKTEDEHDLITS